LNQKPNGLNNENFGNVSRGTFFKKNKKLKLEKTNILNYKT